MNVKDIEVSAAIIVKDNRILATERGYGRSYRHKWEFPGGKIEPGETREEALVREIREELDADIEVGRLFSVVTYTYPEYRVTMYCYICRLISDHITLEVHDSAKWLGAEDIDSVDWLPSDDEIVAGLKKSLLAGEDLWKTE